MVFIHPLCHLGTPMEVSNPKGCGGVMSHSSVTSGSPHEIFRVTCGVAKGKERENKDESCPFAAFGFVLAVIPSIRCSLNSPHVAWKVPIGTECCLRRVYSPHVAWKVRCLALLSPSLSGTFALIALPVERHQFPFPIRGTFV